MNVAGRVAAISGAGGGLGRATAVEFARAGMSVLACDNDAQRLAELESELAEIGGPSLTRVVDVRDDGQLSAFFDAIDARREDLDVLVNVVGGSFQADFLDTNRRGWDALYRQNLGHVLAASHAAARRMVAQGRGGSIISITSIEAHRAAPTWAVYGGLKWAVEGFSRSLAAELGPSGVRVNCVAPDYVVTPGTEELERAHGSEPMGDGEAAAIVPLGRVPAAEEIAGCALFLASDLASFVTGSTLHPDGGALAAGRWMLDHGRWTPRLTAPGAPRDVRSPPPRK